jgi:hypothetical protein
MACVVKVTANSNSVIARNGADLESYALFESENKPIQWICHHFKTLLIEPTHDTIAMHDSELVGHLKSWAVEDSDDGAS